MDATKARSIDYSRLPQHMRGGMQRYIEQGIPPGGFLAAILANDLVLAAMRADAINQHQLFDYAHFLYNQAPRDCWGCQEAIDEWIEQGGLKGIQAHERSE